MLSIKNLKEMGITSKELVKLEKIYEKLIKSVYENPIFLNWENFLLEAEGETVLITQYSKHFFKYSCIKNSKMFFTVVNSQNTGKINKKLGIESGWREV